MYPQKKAFLKGSLIIKHISIKNPFTIAISKIPEGLSKSYFPVLDGFRGIAILIVLVGHSSIGTPFGKYEAGNIGVAIFYVLSGFLITTLLLKEKIKTGRVSFKHFYMRRALRILPVAFLFLIVLAVLNAVFNLHLTLISFLASAFYFRNMPLNYGSGSWYNGHFYTLAVEEQFYFIFPVLIIFFTKQYVKIVCAIILLIPLFNYLVYHDVGIFYNNIVLHKILLLIIYAWGPDTVSILTGTVLAILVFNGTLSVANKKNYFLSAVLFIIGIIFRNSHLIGNDYVASLVFSILIAWVIYLCLGSNDLLSTVLQNKILVWVGIISYSLYVWQQLFTHYQPWGTLFIGGSSLWVNIPALFAVACLSYYLYERKFLKLKEKFK